MDTIPIWLDQRPRRSWFSIYSHMLSPDNKKLRDAIFVYMNMKRLKSRDSALLKFIDEFGASFSISSLLHAADCDKFEKLLRRLETKALASGIIFRLLYTMSIIGEEPSINKAIFLFRTRFSEYLRDNKKIRYNLSRTQMINYYANSHKIIHLCAAYTLYKFKITRNKSEVRRDLYSYITAGHKFYMFGTSFMLKDCAADSSTTMIDPDNSFTIADWDALISPTSQESLCCPIDNVKRLLESYSYKDRLKMFVDTVK